MRRRFASESCSKIERILSLASLALVAPTLSTIVFKASWRSLINSYAPTDERPSIRRTPEAIDDSLSITNTPISEVFLT